MPEEQIIYLDPDDELTKVREKIEDIPARHVILVVPQQTQLRSNVGWRLLHARSREMGKDVQVISPDRQVRAVAKAAGFRVSGPQELSLSSKSRPSTRPTRGVNERKAPQRARGPVNRSRADSRDLRQREQLPPRQPEPQQPPASSPQSTWFQQENRPSRPQETTSAQDKEAAYPPLEIIEDHEYDQPFEFRVDTSHAPSARPLTPHQDEEDEQDPYTEDYRTSRRIREAAQGTASGESRPSVNPREPASAFPIPRSSTPLEPTRSYPFEDFDDSEEFSPSSLPEQHGATFIEGADEIVPNVADISNKAPEIEFLGERDDFMNVQNIPTQQWPDAILNEPEEEPPARVFGSRTTRSGKLPRRPMPDFGDADYLPPVEDRPTITPPVAPRLSGALRAPAASNRGAQPPVQPQSPQSQAPTRNINTRIAPPSARPATRGGRPAVPPPGRRAGSSSSSGRRGSRVTTIVLVSLLLLVLIGIGFLYFGASAKVTITMPSKPFNLSSIKLEATSNPRDNAHNTVASQILSYTASVSGRGTATGTTNQGSASASGMVNITNKGLQQVTIPTGTVLTTTAGTGSISFVTTANAVIPASDTANPNPFVPVPVTAQSAGASGNAGPNTITVIPATSISLIAQASNLNSSQINLTVTNPAALSGGGATQVPAATSSDLQALAISLHQQLQAQVRTWLKQQLHKNDIQGTPNPNVLGSAKPLVQEQLTQVPIAGLPITNKSFTGMLTAHIVVLVVRADSLLAAAQSQLNAAALALRPAYVLATQLPITLVKETSTSAQDGSSISIDLSATGQIMPQIDARGVSASISGKTVDQAKSDIASGNAGPLGVESITIDVSPSFLSIMPFRPERISIIEMPGPGPTKNSSKG